MLTDTERYADLMKQGFMKPLPRARKPKPSTPVASCRGCKNWHRQGEHTMPLEVRKVNEAEFKWRDMRSALIHKGINPDTGNPY